MQQHQQHLIRPNHTPCACWDVGRYIGVYQGMGQGEPGEGWRTSLGTW